MNISPNSHVAHSHPSQAVTGKKESSSPIQKIAKRSLEQTEKAGSKGKKIRAKKKKIKTPVTEPWKNREVAEKAGLGNHYVHISGFPEEIQEILRYSCSTKATVFDVLMFRVLPSIEMAAELYMEKHKELIHIVRAIFNLNDLVNYQSIDWFCDEIASKNKKFLDVQIKLIENSLRLFQKIISDPGFSRQNKDVDIDGLKSISGLIKAFVAAFNKEDFVLKDWLCLTAHVLRDANCQHPIDRALIVHATDVISAIAFSYEYGFGLYLEKKYPDVYSILNKDDKTRFDRVDIVLCPNTVQLFLDLDAVGNDKYHKWTKIMNETDLQLFPKISALSLLPHDAKKRPIGRRIVRFNKANFSYLFELFALYSESIREKNVFFKRGEISPNLDGLVKQLQFIKQDIKNIYEQTIRSGMGGMPGKEILLLLDKFNRQVELMRNTNINSYGGYARMFISLRELTRLNAELDVFFGNMQTVVNESEHKSIAALCEATKKKLNKARFFIVELELLFGTSSRAIEKYQAQQVNKAKNDDASLLDISESQAQIVAESKREEPEKQEDHELIQEKNEEEQKETVNKKRETDDAAALVPCSASPRRKEKESVHNVKPKKLLQRLAKTGWRLLRQKGSHQHFTNPLHPELGLATVPFHSGRTTLSPGVVQSVYELIERSSSSEDE